MVGACVSCPFSAPLSVAAVCNKKGKKGSILKLYGLQLVHHDLCTEYIRTCCRAM